jgi:hypothetical protein
MQGKLPETHKKRVQNANMKVYSRNFMVTVSQYFIKKPINSSLEKRTGPGTKEESWAFPG